MTTSVQATVETHIVVVTTIIEMHAVRQILQQRFFPHILEFRGTGNIDFKTSGRYNFLGNFNIRDIVRIGPVAVQ
ncbi:hypothetical protein BMS3Bbin04_01142 [bacterium BMS3Bbin04]|nr:hypothetical protein BMS3Bbin04_01142 [bacterium BMS3Bbin04]